MKTNYNTTTSNELIDIILYSTPNESFYKLSEYINKNNSLPFKIKKISGDYKNINNNTISITFSTDSQYIIYLLNKKNTLTIKIYDAMADIRRKKQFNSETINITPTTEFYNLFINTIKNLI